MSLLIQLIVGACIGIFAILDIKEHAVPSFLTTAVILALVLIQPQNLIWGISAFTFGWLLFEMDFLSGRFFGGLADVKVMTIIGLMVGSLTQFASLMIYTGGFAVIISVILYYYNSKKMPEEFAFIPVLWFVYVATMNSPILLGRLGI